MPPERDASSPPTVAGPEMIRRVADSVMRLRYETWNFGDSIGFESLIAASSALDDDRFVGFLHGWSRAWASSDRPHRRLDCTAPGFAMVAMAARFGDDYLVEELTRLATYLRWRPTIDGIYAAFEHSPLVHPHGGAPLQARHAALLAHPPAGVFLDCLHFDPPFLVSLGALTSDSSMIDDGVTQALGYVRVLQTPNGLFDHFILEGIAERFGPGWGRGQGWALLGLLDVLETLDGLGTNSRWANEQQLLTLAADQLVRAMVATQRPDGHWNAVVDQPGSGIEGSTAPFMAHGFFKALQRGLVTNVVGTQQACDLARAATLSHLTNDGRLRDVSAAVMACSEPSHYACVPRGFQVPWGQGAALLALCDAVT